MFSRDTNQSATRLVVFSNQITLAGFNIYIKKIFIYMKLLYIETLVKPLAVHWKLPPVYAPVTPHQTPSFFRIRTEEF